MSAAITKLQNFMMRTAKLGLARTNSNNTQELRKIWGYVAIAFNKVDHDRLRQVGADRLCAEWILKNGGAVRLVEIPTKLLRDYNSLPPVSTKFRIKVVDASDSSIMKIGFEHFNGCNFIDTVILHNCKHLEDDGLLGLTYLKSTLQELQVSSCHNLLKDSFKVIGDLKNLKRLRLFDFLYVKNLEEIVKELQVQLPNCKIDMEKL